MTPETLRALLDARRTGQEVVLATRLADGAQRLLPDAAVAGALSEAAARALARDESHLAEIDGETWFLRPYGQAYRLIVVGAVHIAQTLCPLAMALGLSVSVVDPRRGFNTEARFAGVTRLLDWPDRAIPTLAPDARTAIVTLTHDPKLDDPALEAALRGPAFYVGALGSRKTHAARLERLGAMGHAPASLARIFAPVGLRLGAVSAPEIALSIVAQIVAVRRKGDVLS